ncbi:MAG: hypothetical protein ACFE89_06195 [Candidatus Hodarchaeota archaeon]
MVEDAEETRVHGQEMVPSRIFLRGNAQAGYMDLEVAGISINEIQRRYPNRLQRFLSVPLLALVFARNVMRL